MQHGFLILFPLGDGLGPDQTVGSRQIAGYTEDQPWTYGVEDLFEKGFVSIRRLHKDLGVSFSGFLFEVL